MRRLAVVFGFLSIWMFAVGGAAAAGPERVPYAPADVNFDGVQLPLVCAFPVSWRSEANHARTLVFPVNRAGDQVIRSVGALRTRVTNLSTGKSITVTGGFRQDLVFHSDGSVTAVIDGTTLAAYFATDVPLGPSLWFFRGHLVDQLDATFTLQGHRFRGNQQNLCRALM